MPLRSPKRLGHRLADGDAAVLGGVVGIDVQIAFGLDVEIDQRMARQLLEHVVEEADAGLDGIAAARRRGRRSTRMRVSVVLRVDVALRMATPPATGFSVLAGIAESRQDPVSIGGASLAAERRLLIILDPTAAAKPHYIDPSHSARPYDDTRTWHGTTILCVRKAGSVVDRRRRPGHARPDGRSRPTPARCAASATATILAGFAGATADAFTLLERLEAKLEKHPGQLMRACVELAKDWRTDRYLRRLEAMMAVADTRRLAGADRPRATCWSRRTG